MARISKERREVAFAMMEKRHFDERAKNSTAEKFDFSAKSVETYLRDFLYVGGLRNESDFRARAAGRDDLRINGFVCEVKTGGSVGYADNDNWNEDDILPDCHFVAFPVMTEIHCLDDLYDNTAVMLRAEFVSLLYECSRKGLKGTVRFNARRGVLCFQPMPLEKLRARIFEGLNDGTFISFRSVKETGFEE